MNTDLQKLHDVWMSSRAFQNTDAPKISFDDLTNSIVSTGPFYYYIIDFYDMVLSHVSHSIADIHGLNPQTVTFDDILNTIHPDDIEFVANAESFLHRFFQEKIPPERLLSYKMSYSFRSRMKNGEYVLLNHQALLLTLDENGRSGKSLNIHTRIDHLSKFNTRQISLIGLNGEPSFMDMSLDKSIHDLPVFSRREMEIIRLIAQGLNNNEIAENLFIAVLTVKKHRKNILMKSNCKNTAELISKSVIQGLIY
ncbi:DNA-binding CsgD family transcriptional regulator [Pedobacter sp. AK017]|uniref:LuxR C-terminal-related transcriptional regulator n=1 Tax=Pedobacter sp. AK017 TaxID=2723073 RepID=UPI001621D4AF|nr:LuxR C-terminal-related transcriptional regulator [Pedobacter sp. AK017]MBB5437332.1 DNA-binding CsgD family transcriptional regulator [Pedobacter sp. AK017]